MMKPVVLCVLVLVVLVKNGHQQETQIDESESLTYLRLPKSLRPIRYWVKLQPFLSGNFSVEGFVKICFYVEEATDQIILHIDDIITHNETTKVYQLGASDSLLSISEQTFDPVRQFYIVHLKEQLNATKTYEISLKFTGYLNQNMKGFYRSSYEDSDGNTIWLAATQFEPTDARKAFPCFDEPAFKANFTIAIARQEGFETISNMPKIEQVSFNDESGWFWDKFQTSVIMPTYLVAFAVTDFQHVDAEVPERNYTLRIWSRKDALFLSNYSMEVSLKVSQFFEEFLEVPYSLPKQDMIALPDFPATAMENWGLVTYKEMHLLLSPDLTTEYDRMLAGTIISHELAHMWFGNLVSPQWWTDIWLNEGFARYMEFVGFNSFDPSMQILDQMVLNDIQPALQLDSLQSSHPLRFEDNEIRTPTDIMQIFDTLSYSKGASILRMISSILSEETFRKGLTNYLTDMSYSNAEQDDIWKHLTEQAHNDGNLDHELTMKEIMDTWTLQAGYPVLHVQSMENGTLRVSQERFLLANSSVDKGGENQTWWIPLDYITNADRNQSQPLALWLKANETEKDLEGIETESWFLFNINKNGFFRVNYDEGNWNAIAKQLSEQPEMIDSVDRATIIDDAFNLARAGKLEYKFALQLLPYLKNENELLPLKTAFTNVRYIGGMLNEEDGKDFKKALRSLFDPMFNEITFGTDYAATHMEERTRSEIIGIACEIGHELCIQTSVQLFKDWLEDPGNLTMISPNVKSTVFCTAIALGNDTDWNMLWEQFVTIDLATEKMIILNALGCSPNVDTLNKILRLSITPGSGIRKQDSGVAILSVANNDKGSSIAWKFVEEQWTNLTQYFDDSFELGAIFSGITGGFKIQQQLQQLKTFQEKYGSNLSTADRSLKHAFENVEININWIRNYSQIIQKWSLETFETEKTSEKPTNKFI